MAEGSSENLNASILELLVEVRDQKCQINSIQQEVRSNSVIVSSQVKSSKLNKSIPGRSLVIEFNIYSTQKCKTALNKASGPWKIIK